MKHKIFAANWKMYKSPIETQKFFQNFLVIPGQSTLIFFPPALCVSHAIESTSATHIKIGVQNIASTSEGAFTGENSASVAKNMGCEYALVGHSERRNLFQETDSIINQKAKFAQSMGLHVVFCVGESINQRQSNQTKSIISSQLSAGLSGLKNENLIVAYEPVWAIGTGVTASPQQAEETQKEIIEWLNANGFSGVPVLYGGSVKPENAKELISKPSISGFLVGGASLNPESFAQICQA